ncbi:MAG: hypothetical protein KAJ42_17395 [Gemmatimonadetes bacterium]|nr:hypothetical protein [Gemmatimonadota bacterium]
MTSPEITCHTMMHLNGGPEYSTLIQRVFIDGEETNITLGTHTDGRPDFKITGKRLAYQPPGTWSEEDLETLDLLEEGMEQETWEAWILERAPAA